MAKPPACAPVSVVLSPAFEPLPPLVFDFWSNRRAPVKVILKKCGVLLRYFGNCYRRRVAGVVFGISRRRTDWLLVAASAVVTSVVCRASAATIVYESLAAKSFRHVNHRSGD
jgi:hypothetical protein